MNHTWLTEGKYPTVGQKDQRGWNIIQPCCILGMVQSVPLVHLFWPPLLIFVVFYPFDPKKGCWSNLQNGPS